MYFLYVCLRALTIAAAFATGPIGIRLSFEPATLDWNLGDVPIHVINNAVEGLYAVGQDGKIAPNEAESLPKPLSNGHFLITLRADARWSDGRPVTAADYVYSWKRLQDPKTASTYSHLLADLIEARAQGARAIEVHVKMRSGSEFPLLSAFTHWATFPVREDLVDKHGARWAEPGHGAYNGPYTISEYKHDTSIVLVPNAAHRHPGKLSRIEALIVPDDATALRLYESGRIHFLPDLSTLDRARLASRKDYHAVASPVLAYLGIVVSGSPLANPATRAALANAVDRDALIRAIGAPHEPAFSFTRGEKVPPPPLAAAAGFRGSQFAMGYFEKGTNRAAAEVLQAQWKEKLGVAVELKGSEVKSYWSELARKPHPVFFNTYGPPVWDQAFYYRLLRSDNPMNMGRWKNAAYDAAVDGGDWKAAERILREQLPIIPLYFRSYEFLQSPALKGAVLNPMTSLFLGDASLEP
jgi:oligopeptide transport system substrate-binding protein